MVEAGEIYETLLAAFRSWHNVNGSAGLLLDLLIVQQVHQAALQEDAAVLPRTATNRFLERQLEGLLPGHEEGVKTLRLRFIERQKAEAVGEQLHYSPDQIYRLQRHTLQEMAAAVVEQENGLRRERLLWSENGLPPPTYSRLFGVDEVGRRLVERLLAGQSPFLTTVCGLGGIGKTALADFVVRQVIAQPYYRRVVWVSYEPAALGGRPAGPEALFEQIMLSLGEKAALDVQGLSPQQWERELYQLLKDERCLVIVDNLEDVAGTAYLLSQLPRYANPSHFLVTSRGRPAIETPVYVQTLEQLKEADSLALLRHKAETNSILALQTAETKALKEIYECVGGNPLALKLAAGLARTMPLSAILQELRQGSPGPAESIYRRVYRYAWQQLSDPARILLESMALVSETGGRPEQLLTVSGLGEAEMWAAVRELGERSLLEVRGALDDRRYGIHRLTLAFLETEVAGWPNWS